MDIITESMKTMLKSYIDSIEGIEKEKTQCQEALKAVYAAVKGNGFDVSIVKKIISMRKRSKDDLNTEEVLLELYKKAIGM